MTPSELTLRILKKLNIDFSEYPTGFSDILSVINLKKDDICEKIAGKKQGYFLEYWEDNLVASGSDVTKRIYTIPDDVLNHLVRVEVKIDGTDWTKARPETINDIQDFVLEEGWITDNFSSQKPRVIVMGKKLIILSGEISAVVHGLRLWYIQYPDNIPAIGGTTDLCINTNLSGTVSLGFPRQFHELLSRAVQIDWKETNEIPLGVKELQFEQDLESKLKELSPLTLDEQFEATMPSDDGSNY
jgi:hypothetical protein